MSKRNINLYFAENIPNNFDPNDFLISSNDATLPFTNKGSIYYYIHPIKTPLSWKSFFQDIIQDTIAQDYSQRYEAIIFVITKKKNLFALTFGGGNYKLNKSKFIYNFGLKTALNMLNQEGRISSQMSKTVNNVKTKKRVDSSFSLPIEQLNFNTFTDLLDTINGEMAPEYQDFFKCKKVYGGQGLCLSLDSASFMNSLDKIEAAYYTNTYKNHFGFIDNISPLLRNEKELKEVLDLKLCQEISKDKIALFIPSNSVIYQEVESLTCGKKTIELTDEFLKEKIYPYTQNGTDNDQQAILSCLKKTRITAHLQGGNTFHFSLYQCLSIDLQLDKQFFLLEEGQWFRFSPQLSTAVTAFLERRTITTPKDLGKMGKKDTKKLEDEKRYLKRVSDSNPGWILGDRNLASQTEVFDLLNKNTLYHIKKGTVGSAPLSHLFAQGLVAISRLFGEKEFYKEAKRKFPQMPSKEELSLCYGVISNHQGHLPLFSKIMFKFNAENIEKIISSKVSICFIPHD